MADYQGIGNIQNKLKWIFARIIKQMLEAEMDEHLGYKKNSVDGNNFKNIRNGYGKKTLPAITTSTKRMSQCDIEDILREIYGSKISQWLISHITDKILPEVNW